MRRLGLFEIVVFVTAAHEQIAAARKHNDA
jgi:hypothetical protein